MKKKLKKYQDGNEVTPTPGVKKTITRNGGYRTVEKAKTSADGTTTYSTKTNRTVGGMLSGKPRVSKTSSSTPSPKLDQKEFFNQLKKEKVDYDPNKKYTSSSPQMKKGGSVSKSKKK
jgi:hypothetical protein